MSRTTPTFLMQAVAALLGLKRRIGWWRGTRDGASGAVTPPRRKIKTRRLRVWSDHQVLMHSDSPVEDLGIPISTILRKEWAGILTV